MATEIRRKNSMSLTDIRGVPVSTTNRASLEKYERAADLFLGYFNDPFATIDSALAEDPEFIMGLCLRAALIVSATDRNFEPELKSTVKRLEALAPKANDRERQHMAAARAWLDGDYAGSIDPLRPDPRGLSARRAGAADRPSRRLPARPCPATARPRGAGAAVLERGDARLRLCAGHARLRPGGDGRLRPRRGPRPEGARPQQARSLGGPCGGPCHGNAGPAGRRHQVHDPAHRRLGAR